MRRCFKRLILGLFDVTFLSLESKITREGIPEKANQLPKGWLDTPSPYNFFAHIAAGVFPAIFFEVLKWQFL